MADRPIYVTKPHLPPLEDLLPSLREIWDRRALTNNGPFHQEFERKLGDYLGVEHLSLFANGTLALLTALQALRVSGEVITTPFSFVATAHSLMWNGIKPVFADVKAGSFNLDPDSIEAAITEHTTAILPVHCYGEPCDVDAIQALADKYNLRVVYDAAHAFGVECHCGSLANHGDLSVLSFHATKVFNTFEGGAVVCPDGKIKQHIDHLKNFGFVDETTVVRVGINGKMNEFQAAVGLLQLGEMAGVTQARKAIDARYRSALGGTAGITLPALSVAAKPNYAYFPILVDERFPVSRDGLYDRLRANGIFARRYFYPLISEFPMYRSLPATGPEQTPVAWQLSKQVLCLPIYPDLLPEEQDRVVNVILES